MDSEATNRDCRWGRARPAGEAVVAGVEDGSTGGGGVGRICAWILPGIRQGMARPPVRSRGRRRGGGRDRRRGRDHSTTWEDADVGCCGCPPPVPRPPALPHAPLTGAEEERGRHGRPVQWHEGAGAADSARDGAAASERPRAPAWRREGVAAGSGRVRSGGGCRGRGNKGGVVGVQHWF